MVFSARRPYGRADSKSAVLILTGGRLGQNAMALNPKAPCDEGVILDTRGAQPCAPGSEKWVLLVTILGSSMAFIDGTVVNVALPVLQSDLRASVVDVQWIVEAYALFLSALLLVGGALGDRYGRRRVFGLGVLVFALASIWCGVSPNSMQLVIGRALQGIGGALLVPGSLAIIGASFHEERRGQAIGTWSGSTGVTAALGPVLGGWLIEHASWRWAFLINVPIAVIVLAALVKHVPESRDDSAPERLDWPGATLAVLGLGSLTYGLIESSTAGIFDPMVLGLIAVGLLILIGFVLCEARAADPMLPLDLFRSRAFSVSNALTFLLYAALSGALFYVPFNLIQVQGYSATAAGAALLPMIVLISLLSRWAGGLVQTTGPKLPLTIGPMIAAAGFGLFGRAGIGGSYWMDVFPAVVVLGLGMGISVAPLTTTVMSAVESRHSGIASGVNNAVSRVAGLLAIAVMSLILVSVFQSNVQPSLARLDLSPDVRQLINEQLSKLAAIELPDSLDSATTFSVKQVVDQAFISGFQVVTLVAAAMSAAGGIIVALFLGPSPRTTQSQDSEEIQEEAA
jgi:EmrB/QacA subfamily drug resistance transporter